MSDALYRHRVIFDELSGSVVTPAGRKRLATCPQLGGGVLLDAVDWCPDTQTYQARERYLGWRDMYPAELAAARALCERTELELAAEARNPAGMPPGGVVA